jgi:hypothetical protein
VHLCKAYPNARELSKARVTKMIYLADWRSALTRGRPITDITWTFNHYGPYVSDVVDLARRDPAFEVLLAENFYGSPMELVRLSQDDEPDTLTAEERQILDHVIEETAKLYWNDFIALVYSTYPVRTQPRYSDLDLVRLAKEYQDQELAGRA